MQTDNDDREARIARLISQGEMTHEKPGLYVSDDADAEGRKAIPEYDPAVVRQQLPDILQMNFDENDDGCFVVLRDGRAGEQVTVPLGEDPPETTEELIEAVRAFYRNSIDTGAMDEAASLFDAIEADD